MEPVINKNKDESFTDIYNQWSKQPDDENATSKFLKAAEPTISGALRTYAPGQEQNLRLRANLMALEVAKRYKPDKGTHIKSHLMNGLKSLNREAHRRQTPVHIPENVGLEQNKLIKASGELMAERGRPATVEELADRTGMSIKRIAKVRQYKNPVSASTLLSEEGDSLFSREKDPQTVWADYIYHDMDPIDKKIYEWSTGYGGSKIMKKGEIAQHLRMTAPAVSQRVSRIIARLQEGSDFGH